MMSTTVVDLLDSLRAHLSSGELPAPCAVNVTTFSGGPDVSMQIACRASSETAAGLLAWADTLTGITA